MTEKKKSKDVGVTELVDHAILKDANLSRDTVKAWLKRDISGCYILLTEVLRSEEVLEALTSIFYAKYKTYQEQKMKEPELPFKPNNNG